jgi:hypothetical protein
MIDFNIVLRPQGSPFLEEAVDSLNGENIIFTSGPNLAIARLKMFRQATSQYVSYCDDDDIVVNLNNLKNYLIEHKCKAIYTNSIFIDSKGDKIGQQYSSEHEWNRTNFLNGKFLIHQLVIIDREIAIIAAENAIRKLDDDNDAYYFDQIFFAEVALLTEWEYFPHVCYKWRKWDTQKQIHTSKKQTSNICKIRKQYSILTDNKKDDK